MAITKIVAGIGGVGLITGAGLGAGFYLTSNYTIEQLLRKEHPNKAILKKGATKTEWLEKWKEYIKANKTNETLKTKDTWKLEKWSTIGAKDSEVPDAFVEKCDSKLSDKVAGTKDPKYTEFLGWCTK